MSNASTFELFARLALSMAVVLGLMWGIAAMLKRRGMGVAPRRTRTATVDIELLARKSLGKNAAIAIVRAGEQAMVVGITDHQITKLADTELEEIELDDADASWTAPEGTPAGPVSPWKTMLDQMRERSTRR